MSMKRFFQAVETHSGEPMRVVTGGIPNIPGDSVYEQMTYLRDNDDQFRLLMLREPRGYPPLCCNLVVPAKDPKAAAGYIIMEQTEYPLMSGGNTISVATVLLETGMIPMQEPVTEFLLEAPAGLIGIKAECENGKVTGVTFKNQPAFAVHLDKTIDVPHIGEVLVDVAWGGMFYVIADYRQFKKIDKYSSLELTPEMGAMICEIEALILKAAQEQLPTSHPDFPDYGISIAQLSGPTDNPDADWKNAVMVASGDVDFDNPSTWTGAIDRCPCGTGTCAKMAALYAKSELGLNEKFKHEGILGLVYEGELVEETMVGPYKAVIPTLKGQSWIYGYTNYVLDSSDPFTEGYTISDIWG